MNKPMPIKSITMNMESLNMITNGKSGIIGLTEILQLVKEALDQNKPIYQRRI